MSAATDRYKRLFALGASDAAAQLYKNWSADALMAGYGDRAEWSEEDVQAYRDGYQSVRGQRTAEQEAALDAAQDQRIQDFLEWGERQQGANGRQ